MRAAGLCLFIMLGGLVGPAEAAEWSVKRQTSAIDGLRSVTATLESDETLNNSIGAPEHAFLKVQCLDREVGLYVIWPRLTPLRLIAGAYRIDDAPPATVSGGWDGSTAGSATFFPTRILPSVLGQLMTAKRLAVRTASLSSGPMEATFTLGAAGPFIREAIEACQPPSPPPLKPQR